MCGFVVVAGSLAARPISHRALGRLTKRGPDGIGFRASPNTHLVHARLAVINPSDEGLQPHTDSGWSIVFNGEIYNWQELRLPHERTDTAVLLRLYRLDGLEGLKRLHGFWAFSAIDPAGNVHLVRDQLGIRPLYYAAGKDWLAAASTLRALVPLLPQPPSHDYHAMSDWAVYQLPLNSSTFFRNVRRVMPGEAITWNPQQGIDAFEYEDIWGAANNADPLEAPTAAWLQQAQRLLQQAVAEATVGDVGFTSTCSGGLDSSLITRLAAPSVAYHANYSGPDFNETKWAQAVVQGTPTRLFTVNATEPEELDLPALLDDLVLDQDDLTVGSVVLPLSELMQQISRRYKVALLGTGGDELFGGYVRLDMARGMLKDQPHYRAAFERLPAGATTPQRYEILHRKGGSGFFTFVEEDQSRNRFHQAMRYEHPLQFERRCFLPALLTIDDRIAGRYGVEGRPALLHQAFVRYVAQVHPEAMLSHGLKHYARRVFEPFLPEAIINRTDKKGFPTPIGKIINANAAKIRERLTASPYKHLYNLANVRWTTEDAYDRSLFGLLQLDAWLGSYSSASLSNAQAVE